MTIYEQALEAIKAKKINAKLFTGTRKHVFLNQSSSKVMLVYQKRDINKVEQVECAVYMPNRGWVFTLTQSTYAEWVERTGASS